MRVTDAVGEIDWDASYEITGSTRIPQTRSFLFPGSFLAFSSRHGARSLRCFLHSGGLLCRLVDRMGRSFDFGMVHDADTSPLAHLLLYVSMQCSTSKFKFFSCINFIAWSLAWPLAVLFIFLAFVLPSSQHLSSSLLFFV